MLRFELKPHTIRTDVQVVEVLDERGNLRATIYPGDDENEVRVVSRHLRTSRIRTDPVPSVEVRLDAEA